MEYDKEELTQTISTEELIRHFRNCTDPISMHFYGRFSNCTYPIFSLCQTARNVREDYIHSFIDEYERGHELPEE